MATTKVRAWLRPVLRQRRRLRLWRNQLVIFFAVVGPGLITSNVDNDAGGIRHRGEQYRGASHRRAATQRGSD